MVELEEMIRRVMVDVRRTGALRGFVSGPNWNPMVPYDPIASFAMAQHLLSSREYQAFVAIAPEGHLYGYFFEDLGATVLSVEVDYPPKTLSLGAGIDTIQNRDVLLIEDDVVSGTTLRRVLDELDFFEPHSYGLYLGRGKEGQILENVPDRISRVHLAEEDLGTTNRESSEMVFLDHFRHRGSLWEGEGRR